MRNFLVMGLLLLFGVLVLGSIVHVTANFVSPEKHEILYEGSITAFVEEDNITLHTSTMLVLKETEEWRKIKAFSPVSVELNDIEATAATLLYDLDKKTGDMMGKVEAFLKGQDTLVKTETLHFDLKANTYTSSSKTHIWRKDVKITSGNFKYLKESSTLILEKDVYAHKKGKSEVKIKGHKAVIDLDNENMNVEESASIFTKDSTITAFSLQYDMENEGTLTGDVSGVFSREGSLTRFKAEYLHFNLEEENYEGSSTTHVSIWREETYIEAKAFLYKKRTGTITLMDNVYIYDKEKKVKIWASEVIIYMDEDRLKAWNARTEIEVKK